MPDISHKVIEHLLKYLNQGDEVDRCYAARTLGNLKSKKATQALLERIRDDDIDVCIDAITALGKIREPSSIPVLLESLEKDPDGEVKLAVTETLANFKSNEAIELLLRIAEERPEDMAFDENDDWDSWWDLQEKAIIILGKMRVQKAFPVLKTILEDDFSQDIEPVILKAMARIGGEADAYLVRLLTTDDMSSPALKRQRRVATALGFSSSDQTLVALGRALLSTSADTRENVIYALGKRHAEAYLRAILLSLRDPDNNVKRAALSVIQDFSGQADIRQKLDFNQIAILLNEQDGELQCTVLDFFSKQHQLQSLEDTLEETSISLIEQCLRSENDQVITRACQLCSQMGLQNTLEQLVHLARSEQHSEWVRKEAILALGNLLHLTPKNNRKPVLETLRELMVHKNQTVRFSAIQAMIDLSNNLPAQTEESELTPVMLVLAILKGEQFELQDDCNPPDSQQKNDCNTCVKNTDCSAAGSVTSTAQQIKQQFEQRDIKDTVSLIPENAEQTVAPAMSTLEAITMDNIESAQAVPQETPGQQAHNPENGPYISEDLPQELDEFVSIMRQNFSTGKRLIRRKIDTWADARHISARLLALNTHSEYEQLIVNALADSLNDNDEQLRLEACEALAQIAQNNPLIPGLRDTFGKLVTLLDSKDRDMRLACIHALAHCGNPAALIHLLNCLVDEDYLVRIHAINGLVYILKNKAGLSSAQLEQFMVLDDVSSDQVIIALFELLKDQNYSVAMSAIEALVELHQVEAIERFIDVALTDEGQLARKISALLKKLDTQKSTELLLTRLDSVTDSSYRRHVMEMLEVLMSQDTQHAQAA